MSFQDQETAILSKAARESYFNRISQPSPWMDLIENTMNQPDSSAQDAIDRQVDLDALDQLNKRAAAQRNLQAQRIAESQGEQRPYTEQELNEAGRNPVLNCATSVPSVPDRERCLRLETILDATRQDLQSSMAVGEQRVRQIADLRVSIDWLERGEREQRDSLRGLCEEATKGILLSCATRNVSAVLMEVTKRLREAEAICGDILEFSNLVLDRAPNLSQRETMLALLGRVTHNLKPSLLEELKKQVNRAGTNPLPWQEGDILRSDSETVRYEGRGNSDHTFQGRVLSTVNDARAEGTTYEDFEIRKFRKLSEPA